MQGIIPERHQRKIFDLLIQAAFDSVIKEGEVMFWQLNDQMRPVFTNVVVHIFKLTGCIYEQHFPSVCDFQYFLIFSNLMT